MTTPERRKLALDIARAQECLRQARNLAQSAVSQLAELNINGDGTAVDPTLDLDLKTAIKLAQTARKSYQEGVDHLDGEIKRTVICES
jgi:hypothetical protein